MKSLRLFVLLLLLPVLLQGGDRSLLWPKVRAAYIKSHPVCELCGSGKDLNVHHIKPFHLHP